LADTLPAKAELDNEVEFWKETLHRNPDSWDAAEWLMEMFKGIGDLDGAVEFWKTLSQRFPDSSTSAEMLAEALKVKGDLDGVVELWTVRLTSHPENRLAANNLAEALEIKGNLDAAIEVRKRWVKDYPYDQIALRQLGDAFNRKGDQVVAIEFWAVWVCHDEWTAVDRLADVYKTNGINSAIEFWTSWVNRHPDDWAPARELAEVLKTKADFGGATQVYEAWSTRHPAAGELLKVLRKETAQFNSVDHEWGIPLTL